MTARGVCWSTSENPTTTDDRTQEGTGTGSFTTNITGLAANTTYHVRAYATNSEGTSYGGDVVFTTNAPSVVPELRVTVYAESGAGQDPNSASGPTVVIVGEDVTVRVRVENVGTGVASNVVVTVRLPENMEFVSGWIITTPPRALAADEMTVSDGIVTIRVGDVPVGEKGEAELVVRPMASGEVLLAASAECKEALEPVVAAEIVVAEDVYDQRVTTEQPVGLCGLVPALPMLILGLLAGRMSSRIRRR